MEVDHPLDVKFREIFCLTCHKFIGYEYRNYKHRFEILHFDDHDQSNYLWKGSLGLVGSALVPCIHIILISVSLDTEKIVTEEFKRKYYTKSEDEKPEIIQRINDTGFLQVNDLFHATDLLLGYPERGSADVHAYSNDSDLKNNLQNTVLYVAQMMGTKVRVRGD